MALVVDNSPLSPTCNSYASLAEMSTYVTDRASEAVAEAWLDLDPAEKARLLVNATRTIDSSAEWIGRKYFREQKLDWPRYDAYVDGYLLDVDVFPTAVVEATCEMAIWAMQNAGLVAVQQNAAFDSVKVGPITIDFNEKVGGSMDKYYPDIVPMILADLATFKNPPLPSANQLRVARLTRA